MRLQQGSLGGGQPVSVRCYDCGMWERVDRLLTDLDGPAFLAYYHPHCIAISPDGTRQPRSDVRRALSAERWADGQDRKGWVDPL